MKRKFDVFSFVTQLGMASILIALAISILLKDQPAGEKLALLGVLVIFSFFIMALVGGAAKNIPKNEVKVPMKWAVFSLSVATTLFVASVFFGAA